MRCNIYSSDGSPEVGRALQFIRLRKEEYPRNIPPVHDELVLAPELPDGIDGDAPVRHGRLTTVRRFIQQLAILPAVVHYLKILIQGLAIRVPFCVTGGSRVVIVEATTRRKGCLLYTSPSPRDS